MNKMSLQKSIQNFGIKQALKYMEKDPEENIPKLMDMVDKFAPDGWYEAQRNMIRKVIKERGNWYQLILRIYQLDPEVRKAFFQNFIFNASLKGSALQEQLAEENNCNIPWAILLDPTSACNLHCTGCWAAEYGHQLNLDLDTIDSIVWQAHFVTNMFIKPSAEELENFEPDFVVYNASKAKVANYKELGLNSETCVAFNITSKEQVIINTWYGGEMKKGMFSMMNYFLPLKGMAS